MTKTHGRRGFEVVAAHVLTLELHRGLNEIRFTRFPKKSVFGLVTGPIDDKLLQVFYES